MRKTAIAQGEYYHIFNRGNNKQTISFDKRDKIRFLFLIIYFQSYIFFENIGRQVSYFIKNGIFNIDEDLKKKLLNNRNVKLINFALMPNHFHLTLCEFKEGGLSQYMQRVLCAYTKYFNTKYKKSGHLFQGPYKAVHAKDNNQLLYLSTYIHRNPRELNRWKNKEEQYPWSSLGDYLGENRWDTLLESSIILEQFKNKDEYAKFVRTSTAKIKSGIDENLLIDFE